MLRRCARCWAMISRDSPALCCSRLYGAIARPQPDAARGPHVAHSQLLLQLVIIIATARLLGLALRYLGQPAVIGEMAAGIVLGPVVFGALAPEWHAHVFDPASRAGLDALSQLGLVLFM